MKPMKRDVLYPVLFVVVIYPMLAGGWWRYFSGHANQVVDLPVQNRMTQVDSSRQLPAVVRPTTSQVRPQKSAGNAMVEGPRPALYHEEVLLDRPPLSDDAYDEGTL
jgi:hypothetical protein